MEERNIKRATQTARRNGNRATAGGRCFPTLRKKREGWGTRSVVAGQEIRASVIRNRQAARSTKDGSLLSSTERREMAFPSASGFRRAARRSQRLHRFQPAALGRPGEAPTGDWFHYPCTECQGSSDEIPHLIRSLSGPIPGRRWHSLRLVGDQGRKRKKLVICLCV